MSDDQFTKLFKYVEAINDRVIRIEDNMATKDDIRQLTTIMDNYAAHLDTYMAEMAAMQHKIDRLERMIDYLADKAGVSKKILEAL